MNENKFNTLSAGGYESFWAQLYENADTKKPIFCQKTLRSILNFGNKYIFLRYVGFLTPFSSNIMNIILSIAHCCIIKLFFD